jgi:uncharacterized membrane protein YidH (DUF202 family)
MDARLFYIVIAIVIMGDAIAVYFINRQRNALNLDTEDGRKREQSLKIAMIMVVVQSVVVLGVLWAVFQPPLILP